MRLIQRCTIVSAAAVVVAAGLSAQASAYPGTWGDLMRGGEVVVDQQPLPTGGPGADTDFLDDFGYPVWQVVADDILLPETAIIQHLVWWGFYGGTFSGSTEPPTGPETMRVRFYEARASDGLPGETMYEESFLNPSRVATGQIIAANGAAEYLFEADLTTPIQLDAGIPYWLEIVQVGDQDSHYRWEVSPGTGTPFAFINDLVPDWQRTTGTANVAFQLVTPEPETFVLLSFGFGLVSKRRAGRTERR